MTDPPELALAVVDVVVPPNAADPHVALQAVGPMTIAHISGEGAAVQRTPFHIAASTKAVFHLVFVDQGRIRVKQAERSAHVEQGEFFLLDCSRPFLVVMDAAFRIRVFEFSKAALGVSDGDLVRITSSPLRQDHALSAFLLPFLARLEMDGDGLHARTRAQLAQNVTDIVATLISDHLLDASPDDVVRSTLVGRVKNYIAENLGRHELSPQMIASEHNISVRYLHKLFASEGTTVGRWIQAARLERCRSDLVPEPHRQTSVSAVAHRWGFVSAAHFSRVFRSAYGMTPSEWQAASTRPAPSGSDAR